MVLSLFKTGFQNGHPLQRGCFPETPGSRSETGLGLVAGGMNGQLMYTFTKSTWIKLWSLLMNYRINIANMIKHAYYRIPGIDMTWYDMIVWQFISRGTPSIWWSSVGRCPLARSFWEIWLHWTGSPLLPFGGHLLGQIEWNDTVIENGHL